MIEVTKRACILEGAIDPLRFPTLCRLLVRSNDCGGSSAPSPTFNTSTLLEDTRHGRSFVEVG